jgi:hypothetical protein
LRGLGFRKDAGWDVEAVPPLLERLPERFPEVLPECLPELLPELLLERCARLPAA